MALEKITIENFRNLTEVSLNNFSGVNILFGENASGKTSLLEAIYFMSLGKSFRTRLTANLIQRGADKFRLCGKVNDDLIDNQLGLEYLKQGNTCIKINGSTSSVADLAENLPIQIITPQSFDLLEHGSKKRREYFDWGTFHVKPTFLSHWKRFQRALKQRNKLLKLGDCEGTMSFWNQSFCYYGDIISELRKQYIMELLLPEIKLLTKVFLPIDSLSIDFYQGWAKDQTLAQVLDISAQRDSALGFSQYGPHKADLLVKIDGKNAREILSRGQKKLFIAAMKIAQGRLLNRLLNKNCCYLVDDFGSELDSNSRMLLLTHLISQNAQLFITFLDKPTWLIADNSLSATTMKVFHVKQGTVKEVIQ